MRSNLSEEMESGHCLSETKKICYVTLYDATSIMTSLWLDSSFSCCYSENNFFNFLVVGQRAAVCSLSENYMHSNVFSGF